LQFPGLVGRGPLHAPLHRAERVHKQVSSFVAGMTGIAFGGAAFPRGIADCRQS
jgi:hypothetical protein